MEVDILCEAPRGQKLRRCRTHQRLETAVHDGVFCSCNSTNTSSPSIITLYRVRRLEHLAGPSPVLGSNRHRCHGQTILPSSILPCPRGPPQCRQALSVAYMLSSTFATHSILPDAMNSFTLPRSGNSDLTAILISVMLGLSAVSIVSGLLLATSLIACSPGCGTGICRSRNSKLFIIKPINIRNMFAAQVFIQLSTAQK